MEEKKESLHPAQQMLASSAGALVVSLFSKSTILNDFWWI